jgi:hypothetical protein
MFHDHKETSVNQYNCHMVVVVMYVTLTALIMMMMMRLINADLFWWSLLPTRTNFIVDVLKEQIIVYCLFDVREMHGSSYFQRRRWKPCCIKSRPCRKAFVTNSSDGTYNVDVIFIVFLVDLTNTKAK